MLRCREYIRVSSRKQVRGASLDDQRAANARRAAQLGTTGAAVVRDGVPGRREAQRSTFYRHTTGWLRVDC